MVDILALDDPVHALTTDNLLTYKGIADELGVIPQNDFHRTLG
jgi:hypothetical protein